MTQPSDYYTLILGAGDQLGQALAREVAARQCNLLLVSDPGVNIQRFSIGLQLSHEIDVRCFHADLRDHGTIREIADEVKVQFPVCAIINNTVATMSWTMDRAKSAPDKTAFETSVSIPSLLTWLLIPHLKRAPASFVMNVVHPSISNTSCWYSAYSAYLDNLYTVAGHMENESADSGMIVSIYHPPAEKGISVLDDPGMLNAGSGSEVIRNQAARAVKAMLRGERLIIPGFWNQFSYIFNKHTNRWFRKNDSENCGPTFQGIRRTGFACT